MFFPGVYLFHHNDVTVIICCMPEMNNSDFTLNYTQCYKNDQLFFSICTFKYINNE